MKINKSASNALNLLNRVKIPNKNIVGSEPDVLLLPDNVEILYMENNLLKTSGLGSKLDQKNKDLLRMITIDESSLDYTESVTLMPRTLAESMLEIPAHISVQALFFTIITKESLKLIKKINHSSDYSKTSYDQLWLPGNKRIEDISIGDILYITNRRIGGWDGSPERPVIELLGAGGHLPALWSPSSKSFVTMDIEENLVKEIREEFGLPVNVNSLKKLGRFHNKLSNELVFVFGVFINADILEDLFLYTINNQKENISGIYLGEFSNVIALYKEKPEFFAGGIAGAKTNFTASPSLMQNIQNFILVH